MDQPFSLLPLMPATEESHEAPQDVVVQVEDGELSVTCNSQISRKSKTSKQRSSNFKRDKYVHASTQPSVREKLVKTDKMKVKDDGSKDFDESKKTIKDNKSDKNSAKTSDKNGKESIKNSHTRSDKYKLDHLNKADIKDEIVKQGDEEDNANDGLDLDQTERHISGRSEDSETQDNISMTARTENDVSEMPENEIEDEQNPERNAVEVDKTDYGSESLEGNDCYQLNNSNNVEEEIAEEIDACNSDNTKSDKSDSNTEKDKHTYKTMLEERNMKTKENIDESENNEKNADEIMSEAEKIQMCEAILSNYMKAAKGEVNSNEGSELDIEEEIQEGSEDSDTLEELLDDYIADQERDGGSLNGDETVVTHQKLMI